MDVAATCACVRASRRAGLRSGIERGVQEESANIVPYVRVQLWVQWSEYSWMKQCCLLAVTVKLDGGNVKEGRLQVYYKRIW